MGPMNLAVRDIFAIIGWGNGLVMILSLCLKHCWLVAFQNVVCNMAMTFCSFFFFSSQWSLATQMFAPQHAQTHSKENNKALHYWPFVRGIHQKKASTSESFSMAWHHHYWLDAGVISYSSGIWIGVWWWPVNVWMDKNHTIMGTNAGILKMKCCYECFLEIWYHAFLIMTGRLGGCFIK